MSCCKSAPPCAMPPGSSASVASAEGCEERTSGASNDWVNSRVTRIVIVGAGASSSTPKLECLLKGENNNCKACKDAFSNPASPNHRLNPCLLIQVEADPLQVEAVPIAEEHNENAEQLGNAKGKTPKEKLKGNVLIDVCKTFRESTMKVLVPLGVTSLNSVILTHDHADATLGLDDLREFSSNQDATNGKASAPLTAWTDNRTQESMRRVFPYLFPRPSVYTSYVSAINWASFEHFKPFSACGVPVIPFPVEHGPGYISNGYAIPLPGKEGTIVYISDVSMIPPETYAFVETLRPLKLLVLDMLATTQTPVHFNYDEAVEAAKKINAPQTYFVGMGHMLEYHKYSAKLLGLFPNKEAIFARDGLVIYDGVDPKSVGTSVVQ